MVTIDPRLEHPDKIAAALDAVGEFMDTTAIRGATQPQQDAIARFHAAWPKPSVTDTSPPEGDPPPT